MTFLVNLPQTRPFGDSILFFFRTPRPTVTIITLFNSIRVGSQEPLIWVPLHELWKSVIRAKSAESDSDSCHIQLVLSVAKFTRNLIADVPNNQKNALLVGCFLGPLL